VDYLLNEKGIYGTGGNELRKSVYTISKKEDKKRF
jgi:hypothetical protein